jgi:hypothetical protein
MSETEHRLHEQWQNIYWQQVADGLVVILDERGIPWGDHNEQGAFMAYSLAAGNASKGKDGCIRINRQVWWGDNAVTMEQK